MKYKEKNKIIHSAGLLILYDNKILLAHPTNSPEYDSYTIPKGHVDNKECYIETAIRETREEIGLDICFCVVQPTEYIIDYTDKRGNVYKKLHYFLVNLAEIEHEIIPKENLELEEVDWAGFMSYEEAEQRIFWRFKEMLKIMKLNH